MLKLILPFTLLLASCGGDEYSKEVNNWKSVEVVAGKKVARGVTLEPHGSLWKADINPGAELDGVYRSTSSLYDATAIQISYTVEGEGLYPNPEPSVEPGSPAILTVMVQRTGDDWSAKGDKANYRFYSIKPMPLTEGTHEFTIPVELDEWVNVLPEFRTYEGFRDTFNKSDKIWVAFGHWNGRMHGVITNTTVNFKLNSLEIVR